RHPRQEESVARHTRGRGRGRSGAPQSPRGAVPRGPGLREREDPPVVPPRGKPQWVATRGGIRTGAGAPAAVKPLPARGCHNTTGFGSDVYSWDVRGRMKGLTRPGLTWSATYDRNDLRASKTVNGVTTSYLLDG